MLIKWLSYMYTVYKMVYVWLVYGLHDLRISGQWAGGLTGQTFVA